MIALPVAAVMGQGAGVAAGRSSGGGGGGNGDDGQGTGDDWDEGLPLRVVAVIREFYGKLSLSDEDAERLWKKRGITLETSKALGFVSSPKSNRGILEELGTRWSKELLVDAGLWVCENPGDEPRPNSQYYGWGVVGKVKGEEGDEWEWGWTYPILIPYTDKRGEVIDLRPHKRTQKGQQPRLYVPRQVVRSGEAAPAADNGELRDVDFAVMTEGEFKAAAIYQVFGKDAPIAGLPGITMAKPLYGDIEDWLAEFRAKCVVVGYDNEEKGDASLASYQAEEWKRHDSEVWARYLAGRLDRDGTPAFVAHLPNEWRDKNGKADWDGALAKLIRESGVSGASHVEIWAALASRMREEFQRVVRNAVKPMEGLAMFGKAQEQIRRSLERLRAVRSLPAGGDDEEVFARRLQRLARKLRGREEGRLTVKQRWYLHSLAKNYRDVKGGYYILKGLKESNATAWEEARQRAGDRGDAEVKRACELVLKGVPESITDFVVDPMFVLNKGNSIRTRVLRLVSAYGVVKGPEELDSASFAQPSRLREWLHNHSNGATWRAGERELNDLQKDLARELIDKEVISVPMRGYDKTSGLTFFEDVAYAPELTAEGTHREVFPNRNGIFWYKGNGYQLSEFDQEGQKFCQSPPLMRPKVNPFGKVDEVEGVRRLFQEMSRRLHETIGGYGGYLALGALLSYGAAREIFETHAGFPSLWLTGESRQGKSSLSRWILRIWGSCNGSGMPLPDSTKVGVSIALHEYGDLPVWLEEYQPTCPSWMVEKLKEVYGRESGLKKTFDEVRRVVRAGVIVTGVATSSDAQLRSRYCHVHVSAANRKGNHYEWFEAESMKFYAIGRYLMRHRAEFGKLVLQQMRSWMECKELVGVDDRARIVHGASYASFAALSSLLESHGAEDIRGFKEYLLGHVAEAVGEVQQHVWVNSFWGELLAANTAGEFGHTRMDVGRYFKVVEDNRALLPPMSDYQKHAGSERPHMTWRSYRLYVLPEALNVVRMYKRKMGQDFPLSRDDLRNQMRSRPYWIPGNLEGEAHLQRFPGKKSPQRCWCIMLDRHEMGYQQVSDEVFDQSRFSPGDTEREKEVPRDEWCDPRRGDLYVLLDALEESGSGKHSQR